MAMFVATRTATMAIDRAKSCFETAEEVHRILVNNPQASERDAVKLQLQSLQFDGKQLSDHAKNLKSMHETINGRNKDLQKRLAVYRGELELSRRSLWEKKGDLVTLKSRREGELLSAESRQSNAKWSLQRARMKLHEEEERSGGRLVKGVVGGTVTGTLGGAGAGAGIGALFGLIGGPIGVPVGALIGTIVGGAIGTSTGTVAGTTAAILYLTRKVDEALDYECQCQREVNTAESMVQFVTNSLLSIERSIEECESSIKICVCEIDKINDDIAELTSQIAFLMEADTLWQKLSDTSKKAKDATKHLESILTISRKSYRIHTGARGTSTTTEGFLKAWKNVCARGEELESHYHHVNN